MCTVSIIVTDQDEFRLACNRDEAVTRPAALPPRPSRFGERIAMMPVDPVSGGTWIAANDAGLAMVLLNASLESPDQDRPLIRVSRGTIIPSLIDCAGIVDAARRALEEIAPSRHAPFRLVMTDGRQLTDIQSDGRAFRTLRRPLGDSPVLFTSSGLGDRLVQEPRERLFATMMRPAQRRGSELTALQDSYHRHSWPDQPHLSVCMRRPGARTVSHTVIESKGDILDMMHAGDAPDSGVAALKCRLLARRAPEPLGSAAC